jgi:hypothetical protein
MATDGLGTMDKLLTFYLICHYATFVPMLTKEENQIAIACTLLCKKLVFQFTLQQLKMKVAKSNQTKPTHF